MTEPNYPTTAEEMVAVANELVHTDEEVESADLPVTLGQDTAADLVPRSIKIPAELDRRATQRALRLGLSKSAYIRSLIERDLFDSADHDRPVSVLASELERIAAELKRTA